MRIAADDHVPLTKSEGRTTKVDRGRRAAGTARRRRLPVLLQWRGWKERERENRGSAKGTVAEVLRTTLALPDGTKAAKHTGV